MTNLFLKVNKDFFLLGLNPTEVLVLAQIMEFNTNTGDFFMSDKSIAEMLNVSDKTISRAIKTLEEKGFITRATKNIKGGKERHIAINLDVIEAALTTDKMSLVEEEKQTTTDKMSLVQQTKCPLYNGQNDFIKDNIKEKIIKDKNDFLSECIESCNSASGFVF